MARHDTDLLSLGFGLIFAVTGLVLVLGEQVAISLDWLAPTIVIALGAILIAAGWSRRERPTAGPEEG